MSSTRWEESCERGRNNRRSEELDRGLNTADAVPLFDRPVDRALKDKRRETLRVGVGVEHVDRTGECRLVHSLL